MTLAELLRKYLDDELSPEELRLFREAAMQNENRAELDRLLAEWMGSELHRGSAEAIDVDAWYEELTQRHGISVNEAPAGAPVDGPPQAGEVRRGHRVYLFFATAAAVCLLAVAGIFLFRRPAPPALIVKTKMPLPVIIPAGNKAVLTLADGSHIVLDSAAEGTLARQGGVQVIKLAGGQLLYKNAQPGLVSAPSGAVDAHPLYNEITTPRGGFYELLLPDGSKVWLDAASSLRFPTAFTGASRCVELTGEAYFEVAPGPQQPFLITTQGVTVQVLGTELNLMAYADEDAIRTTLVNGAVRVVRGSDQQRLRPGEQAAWLRDGQRWQVSTPDMRQVLAWKRMEFRFEGLPIDAIMRQIGRWYDVDIVFRGPHPVGEFNGVISRKQSVADLLTVLEQTDIVHFTIEGRKVIVERKL
ncbi:MAG TPA: FecR family protein [Puia sp.]|nr:FecR family protein [Puia sp.]